MERPIKLIIFDLLPNDFDLSFLIKSIFAICSIFTVILGLLVHRRILSFVKKNDGRHVDQIIAFQTVFNCFLIPISLGWFVALHWLYEMKQYISPQGCYIVTFLGKLFLSFSSLFLLKDWEPKKVTIYFPIFYFVKHSENILFFYLHFT